MGGKAIYLKRICSFIVFILLLLVNIAPLTPSAGAQPDDWSEDVRLTFTNERSTTPAIAVEGDKVHVIWSEAAEGFNYHLWYINSYDGGITWNSPICLANNTPVEVYVPKIAVYQNNIHVIWIDYNDKKIHYIHSQDNGNSWDAEIILPPLVYTVIENWDISVYHSYLHISYVNINNRLEYIRSLDNGISWELPIQIAPTISNSGFASIAVNGSNVHVVCNGIAPGNPFHDIYYIRSEDNGETWGQSINITRSLDNYYLDLSVYDDNIYIVYRAKYNRQIFLSHSQDNGNNWTRNINISNSTGPIFDPIIATEKNNVYIAWRDYRNGLSQVFLRNSSDGCITWGDEIKLTNTSSWFPDIIIKNEFVHLVWGDTREDDEEIYYKYKNIPIPDVDTTIDIDPNTLNLKSKGKWITAYIELNEYYDVNDINISSILLENSIPAEHHPSEIGDYDNDSIPDLMAKFDRSEVEDLISSPAEEVVLTITGKLNDGKLYQGQDVIRAI